MPDQPDNPPDPASAARALLGEFELAVVRAAELSANENVTLQVAVALGASEFARRLGLIDDGEASAFSNRVNAFYSPTDAPTEAVRIAAFPLGQLLRTLSLKVHPPLLGTASAYGHEHEDMIVIDCFHHDPPASPALMGLHPAKAWGSAIDARGAEYTIVKALHFATPPLLSVSRILLSGPAEPAWPLRLHMAWEDEERSQDYVLTAGRVAP